MYILIYPLQFKCKRNICLNIFLQLRDGYDFTKGRNQYNSIFRRIRPYTHTHSRMRDSKLKSISYENPNYIQLRLLKFFAVFLL